MIYMEGGLEIEREHFIPGLNTIITISWSHANRPTAADERKDEGSKFSTFSEILMDFIFQT